MGRLLTVLFVLALTACAGSPISEATHKDLAAAAARAEKANLPARAAVYRAEAARLTAVETQVKACKEAIAANLPKAQDPDSFAGPIDAFEAAAEAVDNLSGVPTIVKLNCAPLPLILPPVVPKF